MSFQLPKYFAIKGELWTVVEKEHVFVDEKLVWGSTDTETRTIEICSTLSNRVKQQTLYHEVNHAALHELHLDDVLSEEMQEILCDGIAKCMMDYNASVVH